MSLCRSISFSITVKGWKRDETSLWEPGIVCTVNSPALLVDDPVDMIVSQVNYSFGTGGETTSLTLVPVDSFEPEPEKQKPKKAIAPKKKLMVSCDLYVLKGMTSVHAAVLTSHVPVKSARSKLSA